MREWNGAAVFNLWVEVWGEKPPVNPPTLWDVCCVWVPSAEWPSGLPSPSFTLPSFLPSQSSLQEIKGFMRRSWLSFVDLWLSGTAGSDRDSAAQTPETKLSHLEEKGWLWWRDGCWSSTLELNEILTTAFCQKISNFFSSCFCSYPINLTTTAHFKPWQKLEYFILQHLRSLMTLAHLSVLSVRCSSGVYDPAQRWADPPLKRWSSLWT